jgi:hypothetical protein
MLKLAGQYAAGTITSWVGPKTLREHIAPTIAEAAREAGRAAPQVVAGLPIALTNDVETARAGIAQRAEWYNSLPSYRAMLDIEGAENPAELAMVGDEASLRRQLKELEESGATEFAAQIISSEPGGAARTAEFLRSQIN